ncbi:flagellar biosynthesis protein FlhF [Mitsuokella sp. oral taxon 131]|uniref:flagellar biosynthesis protein FlhF n=1 Tax=Mitsuokella sp. oral taxon 131 TaxID=1321780 RepID=UPI0003ADB8C9|nr:flagellar biosynthesis protein FlhF [Mitsuokella sp. oral taxon 131]ERL03621.1 flagellar biosynthesis protein FlhF [Mitsuokella sp. oral taxon 131 str. W9106]
MQIKVVKAPTMKEAMEQVKYELGKDAVILHTKRYKEKNGILGMGAEQEVVEVTAAVEDEPDATASRAGRTVEEAPPVKLAPQPASVLAQYRTNGTEEGVRMAKMPISPPNFSQPAAPVPAFSPNGEETADDGAAKQNGKEETPMQEKKREDTEKIHRLEQELAQMKTLLAQVMSKDVEPGQVSVQEALRRQEVSEDILKDMAATLAAGDTLIDSLDDRANGVVADYLARKMHFSDGIELNQHGVRVAALIGATGVGKTTTLAKIAARFVLERGIKVALVTADTYRISAVEQLKTYSDILGLPIEIVYSPDELKVAIHKHRDKDLILIDTAGRSQHNAYQMKELQDFLAVYANMERHLVLSATTKERDAAEIIEKFAVCDPTRVIFTKTDETSSVGLILNLLAKRELPLSYFTTGQSVPDDIVPAGPAELAAVLLRE